MRLFVSIRKGFFDVAGCCIFFEDYSNLEYVLGFMNTSIARTILSITSPTLNFEAGQIASLPIVGASVAVKDQVAELVRECICASKQEWDTNEISWDFKRHSLL